MSFVQFFLHTTSHFNIANETFEKRLWLFLFIAVSYGKIEVAITVACFGSPVFNFILKKEMTVICEAGVANIH